MKKILTLAAALPLLLAACGTPPPVTAAPVPISVTVNDPIAGIAQMASADVAQGVADLVAAGANLPTAPIELQDSYTCGVWLQNAIPQAQQIVSGLVPSLHAKGAYSLFIEAKIAYIKGKGAISSAQSTFLGTFNHYCGASVAGDVNAINVLLAKVGIGVAGIAGIPATGGLSGVAGGFLSGLIPQP